MIIEFNFSKRSSRHRKASSSCGLPVSRLGP